MASQEKKIFEALDKIASSMQEYDSAMLKKFEQWALWQDCGEGDVSDVEQKVDEILSVFEHEEDGKRQHGLSRFAFGGALQMDASQHSKQTEDVLLNYVKMGVLSQEQKKHAIKNSSLSKIILPRPNEGSYAACRGVFLLQAINQRGASSAPAGAMNNPMSEITRILGLQGAVNEQEVIQQAKACLEKAATTSIGQLKNAGAANNDVAITFVRALIQAYMRSCSDNDSHPMLDVRAKLDTIIVSTFKVASEELKKFLEATQASISNANQSKFAKVFRTEGSIVSIWLQLCFFLCSESALVDQLDDISLDLIGCAKKLQECETAVQSSFGAEDVIYKTIGKLQDQVQYVIGAVAYRLIRYAPYEQENVNGEATAASAKILCQNVLKLASEAGRLVNPHNFTGEETIERTNQILNSYRVITKDKTGGRSFFIQQQQTLIDHESEELLKLVEEEDGEQHSLADQIIEKCKQDAQPSASFFARQQFVEQKPYILALFATMIKFQGKYKCLEKLQGGDDSDLADLKGIMHSAATETSVIFQNISGQSNDDTKFITEKKQDVLQKARTLVQLKIGKKPSQELKTEVMKALGSIQMSSEDLRQSLEEDPFHAALKRAIGINMINSAIKATEIKEAERLMTLLTWFQRAMRTDDSQEAHYLSGLPPMNKDIKASLQNQFKSFIQTLLEKIKEVPGSELDDNLLCSHLIYGFSWSFRREDFEWLAGLNIFETLLAGNPSIRKSLGQDNSPTKFHQAQTLGTLPVASCIWQVCNQIACSLLREILSQNEVGGINDLAETKQVFGETDLPLAELKPLFGELCAFLYCNVERYLELIPGQSEDHLGAGEKFPSLVLVVSKVSTSLINKVTEQGKGEYIPRPAVNNQPENENEWICQACEWANPSNVKLCEFCQVHRPLNTIKEAQQTDDQIPEEQDSYSEVALWGILGNLELLVDLTAKISFQNQLVDPKNVSLILRIALEASPQNQIMAHRILQHMLSSPLVTDDVLEEAVRVASQIDGPVFDILNSKTEFRVQNNRFMQIIFHQVMASKEFIYRYSFDTTMRVSCATAEALRTIKTILYIGGPKLHSVVSSLKAFVTQSLKKMDQLSLEALDAVLSLVPEMAPPKVTIGSHCEDLEDEKKMTLLGHYRNRKTIHFRAVNTEYKDIKAVDVEDEAGFLVRELGRMRSLIDVDSQVCEKIANTSLVYRDAQLLHILIDVDLKFSDYDKDLLFTSCFYRGLQRTIEIQGQEYLDFLEDNDLLNLIVQKLIDQANKKLKKLNPVDHLEQFADVLRERAICDKSGQSCLVNCTKTQLLMAGQCFSVRGTTDKFLTLDHKGNILLFTFEEDYGAKKGKGFQGRITDRPSFMPLDNIMRDDQIFVVDLEKLKNPSEQTYKMLKYSRLVITDSSIGLLEVIKKLEQRVKDNPNAFVDHLWDECFPQRFLVMRNKTAFAKLKQINQYGLTFYCDDEQLEEMEERVEKYTEISVFDHLAPTKPGKGFWLSGSVTTQKCMAIMQCKDSGFNMSTFFKNYSQARIANHRAAEAVWEMIGPTMEKMEAFMERDKKPCGEENEQSDLPIGIPADQAPVNGVNQEGHCYSQQMSENLEEDEIQKIHSFFERTQNDIFNNQSQTDFIDLEDPDHEELAKYRSVLNSLILHRSRRILLLIFAQRPQLCLQLLSEKFQDADSLVFQLLHDEYALSSIYGYKKSQQEAKELIQDVLKAMSDESKSKFLQDLLRRGSETVNNFFNEKMTKSIGSDLLNPNCLLLFSSPQFAGEVNLRTDNVPVLIQLYDLLLTFAFGFTSANDVQQSQDLLQTAKALLDKAIATGASELPKEQCQSIVNNELIRKIFFSDDKSQKLLLTARGQDIFQLVESFKQLIKEKEDPTIILKFRLNKKADSALNNWAVIRDGMKSDQIFAKTKMNLLLQDESCRSQTSKWGKVYASDLHIYDNQRFKTTIQADEIEDKVIYIDKNTSEQTVIVTRDDGETLMANARRLDIKTSKNSMTVPRGTSATIEVRQSHPSVIFSGKMQFKQNLESRTWKALFDSSVVRPKQVCGNHHQAMFVGEDDSLWALGKGLTGPDDQGWLRKVACPAECQNFVKVLHGPQFRLVFTRGGKLFVNGLPEAYEDILDIQGDPESAVTQFQEVDLDASFAGLDSAIVDVAICSCSKEDVNMIALVTETGRVFVRGGPIYKDVPFNHRATIKSRENENDCFELLLPVYNSKAEQVYQAKNVHMVNDHVGIWLTCEDPSDNNNLTTIAVGKMDDDLGCDFTKDKKVKQKPCKPLGLIQKHRVYFTKVCGTKFVMYGIDQEKNLWVWGGPSDDMVLYDYTWPIEHERSKTPSRVKWFIDRNLKILDVQVGANSAIVQAMDINGVLSHYGMPNLVGTDNDEHIDSEEASKFHLKDNDQVNMIGGFEQYPNDHNMSYKKVIQKIKIDAVTKEGQEVVGFGASKVCTFFLLGEPRQLPEDEESKELVQIRRKAMGVEQGLLHYFKDVDGWNCLAPNEYADNKRDLPDICFATRHPLTKRAQFDKLDELYAQAQNVDLDTNATVHDTPTTNKSQNVPASDPLYYSHSTISEKEQKIVASESEAIEGGQTWDLNPLIFYRVKKPVRGGDLSVLPQVRIDQEVYNQDMQHIRQIFIVVRHKEISQQEINEALENASQSTKETINTLQNFTLDHDKQILNALEKQMKERFPDAQDFVLRRPDVKNKSYEFVLNISQFTLGKGEFQAQDTQGEQTLAAFNEELIRMRAELLLKMNMIFYKIFKLVDQNQRLEPDTNHGKHYALKEFILPTLRYMLVKNELATVDIVEEVESSKKCSVTLKNNFNQMRMSQVNCTSKFHQLIVQINKNQQDMPLSIFRNHKNKAQPFVVGYQEEKVIDQGGAYRAVLTDIMEELKEGGTVDCLKRLPGENEIYILNDRVDDEDYDSFTFIGGLLAFSFLTRQPFSVDLADPVWKQVIGDKLLMEDMLVVDEAKYHELEARYPRDENGRFAENELRDKAIKNYFEKYQTNADYIRQGMNEVLDGNIDVIAYLPLQDIKERICGRATYTCEELKKITKYNHPEFESQQDVDQHEQWFWEILDSFNDEQLASYLKFVWGRDRLPSKIIGEQHIILLNMPPPPVHTNHMSQRRKFNKGQEWERDSIPRSHTCQFQLEIPYFSSKEIFKQKLMYAIENADGIND